MWQLCQQRKGQTRATASLNTSSPSITPASKESKLTCIHQFICCNACVVYDERECDLYAGFPTTVFPVKGLGATGVLHVLHVHVCMREQKWCPSNSELMVVAAVNGWQQQQGTRNMCKSPTAKSSAMFVNLRIHAWWLQLHVGCGISNLIICIRRTQAPVQGEPHTQPLQKKMQRRRRRVGNPGYLQTQKRERQPHRN